MSALYTNPNTKPWPGRAEDWFDMALARRAAERIAGFEAGKPFALFVNFWSPHCPLSCPEPYFSMYRPQDVPLPRDVGEYFPGQSPLHLLNCPGLTGRGRSLDDWRRSWAAYLGMVSLVDEAVGVVLDALRAAGRWDRTLIWFTADHGEMLGSHNLFQKMCLYDSAVRVPAMVKPPASVGAAPGRIRALTQHLDVAPTVLDYLGAAQLATASTGALAGRSIRPQIQGAPPDPDRCIVTGYDGNSGRSFHQRAIVDGRYKLIHNHGLLACDAPGRFAPELYDLTEDPRETRNCLAKPTAEERAAGRRLLESLRGWMSRVDPFIPPPDAPSALQDP